jgi:hypothetical protein
MAVCVLWPIWHTRTTSSRNSSGQGFGTATSFPPALQGKMSPDRAADPFHRFAFSRIHASLRTAPTMSCFSMHASVYPIA